MLPLRFSGRWRLAGACLLLAVLAGALLPVWLFPDLPVREVVALDKWIHGVAFLVLGAWFSGQYRRSAYWRVALGLLAFGALIELCQYLTVYRSAELEDFLADAVGLALGLGLGLAGLGGWSLRLEDWLLERRQAR